ncbi:MAG: GNAT family N-acetyltransferase [Nocardiopsaceae bacterium]|nr:GNAT family N-acetyltransferase [Nocardiopsaceae bacterium]
MPFSRTTSPPGAQPGPEAPWPIRPISESEFPAYAHTFGEALLAPDPFGLDHYRAVTEFDRTLAALDGDQIIGGTTVHSFTMTLPGGPRPVAGVSAVGVWPTHRRRGVLSALMRRQLADIRERGENVAALFASEGAIYGRFGYGPASTMGFVTLHRSEGVLRPDAPRDPALRLRLSTPGESRRELAIVHQAAALQRVGEFQRNKDWWELLLRDAPEHRGGYSAYKCAIVEDDAGPLGYALYRIQQHVDDHGVPASKLWVVQHYATAPAAHTLLWEHLFSRDLIGTISIDMVAPDDPLYHLLADRYRARTVQGDGLWIRLVDLPGAVEQRSYAAPVDVVVEVADRDCPWNAGRWRLTADTGAARCCATEADPDIRLDVAHLGAAYLGGMTLGSYLAAGLITEETTGAVQRLDTALNRSDEPHCGAIF